MLKININGSFLEGSLDGVIGCVRRDYKGRLVDGFLKSVKASSIAQAEVLAMAKAPDLLEA